MTHELSELSRWVAVGQADGRTLEVVASEAECDRLAERFDLVGVDMLEAELRLDRDGTTIHAKGRMQAGIVQSCAISGEDLPVRIDETITLRFVPETALDVAGPDEEIELDASDCDEIPYIGDRFDIGEAVAQSLALAIDPFAVGPEAERIRKEAGLDQPERENPFAALKRMKL